MTIGDLITVVGLTQFLITPMTMFGRNLASRWASAEASGRRIREVLGADFEHTTEIDEARTAEFLEALPTGLTVVRGTDHELISQLRSLPRTRVIIVPHAADLFDGSVADNVHPDRATAEEALRVACCNDIPVFGNATSRVDFLAGYRYGQLDEQLYIFEDSTSLDMNNPGDFNIRDAFVTHNEFHGGEAGVVWEWDRRRFTFELEGRIALGTVQQDVFINGNTVVSNGGFSLSQTGGILAQRTNIGHYERNRFSVIPELSATIAFKVTERLRLTAGYTFVYWSQVVRPGDQIDLDLNPNLFPPEAMPFSGPLRPRFTWRESDFWAQGVSAGVDYRW